MAVVVDKFAQALGEFCWNFSIIEGVVQSALYRLAGIRIDIGNAVFSGVRVEGGMQHITRLAEVRGWSETKKAELKYVFDQLSIINKLRNDILHYGAYRLGGDYIVSNRRIAHIPERIREIRISHTTLEAASGDLAEIDSRLHLLAWEGYLPAEVTDAMRKSLTPSWRYKQPPPAWPGNTTPKTPPKQKRPPRPSAASRRKTALQGRGGK
jgi:hypothetical protein